MKNGLTVGVVVGLLAVAAAAAQAPGSLAAVASPSRRPPVLLAQSPQVATRRLALVIGNKDYKNGVLSNSLNDAEDVSRVLRKIGFEVTLVKNANIEAMEAAAEDFRRDIRRSDVALFYFSGHGLEAAGQSYLIPLGLDDLTEPKLKRQAYKLNDLVEMLEATDASARLFILDACRSELPRGWRTNNRSSFNRGLATSVQANDTVIFYSAKAGMFAADSLDGSRNSPFTTFLLRHLPTPNLEIQYLIQRTTSDVLTATRGKQRPYSLSSRTKLLFLHPVPDASPQPVVNASADRPALPARAKPDSLTQAPAPAPTPPTTATLPSPAALKPPITNQPMDLTVAKWRTNPDQLPRKPAIILPALNYDQLARYLALYFRLKGHTSWVRSVAFSPDGKRIVSGSDDKTLRIWDSATGKPIGPPLQGHSNTVASVAFSPDSRYIVSGSLDSTLRLWDATTGKTIWESGEPNLFSSFMLQLGIADAVYSVAFSPDGKHIVSGSSNNILRLWDSATGKLIGEPLRGHTSWVLPVAFSPDGKLIISGARDKTVRLWNAATGKQIGLALQGHADSVFSVAFSPDGRRIVSGSSDKTLRIWDITNIYISRRLRMALGLAPQATPIGAPLQGHTNWVNSVAFSPDGRR
ncbi:MAG: hypothetical protein FJ083_13005, partial [Cyanobacteria bacterium K_Offshore_surface_m2_239]|nr:hypothetical protein [Cyanobacteria bacterium K_Offshore_surface_m2_239]